MTKAAVFCLAAGLASAQTVSLTVNTGNIVHSIDPKIYGQSLELSNGGIWGEVVWNRSFEETLTWGVQGIYPDASELEPAEALHLLDGQLDAVSVPAAERQEVLRETLGWWPCLEGPLAKLLSERAARLAEEHGRLADMVGSAAKLMQIEPQMPPDLLGLVVLLPVVSSGVSR